MNYKHWLKAQKEITTRPHSGEISEETYWNQLKQINTENREYRENARKEKLEIYMEEN